MENYSITVICTSTYMEGIQELFKEYLANESKERSLYLNDCMDLLHGLAQEKGIEFDG